MKAHKNISVSEEVAKDMESRVKYHGFIISEWFEKKYREEFMNSEVILKEIAEKSKEIEFLKKKLEDIESAEQVYKASFSRSEVRFFQSVNKLLSEGKDWKSLCARFNAVFNKDLKLEVFKENVRYYSKKKEGSS